MQVQNPHCVVKIHDPEDPKYMSNMRLLEGNFAKHTYDVKSDKEPASEDDKTYKCYTMAHELGHASGFDDEYLEAIEEDSRLTPILPRFEQWYKGMPYSIDKNSMMNTNRAPRLRHFWTLCKVA